MEKIWIDINDTLKPQDGEQVKVKFKNGFVYNLAWWNKPKQLFTDTNHQPIVYNGEYWNIVTHWRKK